MQAWHMAIREQGREEAVEKELCLEDAVYSEVCSGEHDDIARVIVKAKGKLNNNLSHLINSCMHSESGLPK
jgi:hypothetical protein